MPYHSKSPLEFPVIQDGRATPSAFTRNERVARLLWRACHMLFVRLLPLPARFTHVPLLRLFGARIAPGCTLARSVEIEFPWLLEIDELCVVGPRVKLYNLGSIRIGKHTVVSQGAHLCAGTHDYRDPGMPLLRKEIVVGEGCWICAESFLGPGVRVGDHAVVGARAVATKDVPQFAIVAGNPAKIVKWRSFVSAGHLEYNAS